MSLTKIGTLPGPPTKHIYENSDTGDRTVSNYPLNGDGTRAGQPTSNAEAQDASDNAALGADETAAVDPVNQGTSENTAVQGPADTSGPEIGRAHV